MFILDGAPYIWHKNDGDEVFIVVGGAFIMRYREDGIEHDVILKTGDICFFTEGVNMLLRHNGAARALVIEKQGGY